MNGFQDSIVRTMVSSGSDALNLLFEAAHQQNPGHAENNTQPVADHTNQTPTSANAPYLTPSAAFLHDTPSGSTIPSVLPSASSDVYHVWNACRFVKMGWFSAQEAILYVDL